jgi:hypothetical protein
MNDDNFKDDFEKKMRRFSKTRSTRDYPSEAERRMVPEVTQREAADRIIKRLQSNPGK